MFLAPPDRAPFVSIHEVGTLIRESRRIVARTTVRQQDVSADYRPGARAADCTDSVGVGWYPIDIHGAPGDVVATGPTRPFQIPLGALIPRDGPANLLAACKNIGTTHMTSGCYRLHPIEWNIGEAAGALGAVGGVGARPPAARARRWQRRAGAPAEVARRALFARGPAAVGVAAAAAQRRRGQSAGSGFRLCRGLLQGRP